MIGFDSPEIWHGLVSSPYLGVDLQNLLQCPLQNQAKFAQNATLRFAYKSAASEDVFRVTRLAWSWMWQTCFLVVSYQDRNQTVSANKVSTHGE